MQMHNKKYLLEQLRLIIHKMTDSKMTKNTGKTLCHMGIYLIVDHYSYLLIFTYFPRL